MRIRPVFRILCLFVLMVVLDTQPLYSGRSAGGLQTVFGEVRLQNLAIGKTYSVSRMAAAPLILRNTSDEVIRVHVDAVIPSRYELRSGALPVPDLGWVRLEASDLELSPQTTVRTDVSLSLPYDPDLAGKTFQVDLWSWDARAKKDGKNIGHHHRLLFTVEMDYRDDTEAQFSFRLR